MWLNGWERFVLTVRNISLWITLDVHNSIWMATCKMMNSWQIWTIFTTKLVSIIPRAQHRGYWCRIMSGKHLGTITWLIIYLPDSLEVCLFLQQKFQMIDGSTVVFLTWAIWRIFVVRFNGHLWEPLIFLHLFLNVSLKSLLLFNNQLVLIYLYHIWVKIASNYVHLLF